MKQQLSFINQIDGLKSGLGIRRSKIQNSKTTSQLDRTIPAHGFIIFIWTLIHPFNHLSDKRLKTSLLTLCICPILRPKFKNFLGYFENNFSPVFNHLKFEIVRCFSFYRVYFLAFSHPSYPEKKKLSLYSNLEIYLCYLLTQLISSTQKKKP